jgi:hypothetical protein
VVTWRLNECSTLNEEGLKSCYCDFRTESGAESEQHTEPGREWFMLCYLYCDSGSESGTVP